MPRLNLYLTFDDVLLLPGYSDLRRKDVDVSTRLTRGLRLSLPVLSSPMDTVTEARLAITLAQAGGLGIIHKNLSPVRQAQEIFKVKQKNLLVGAAVAYGEGSLERANRLVKAGADVLVIDTAHGQSKAVIEMTRILKRDKRFRSVGLVSGNVGTADGVRALIRAGADAVKVGIGPGSICTTRVVAGIGVPQLSAVMEAVRVARGSGVPIIADGGINHSGDIVKALAAGAAAVMIGRLFAGSQEAPGKLARKGKRVFKAYRGMGSFEAMQLGSKDRYGQAGLTVLNLVPEGVSAFVPYTGPLSVTLTQLMGGLKSGMVYVGAKNLIELKRKAKFIRITEASLRENHPHHLSEMQAAPNYR